MHVLAVLLVLCVSALGHTSAQTTASTPLKTATSQSLSLSEWAALQEKLKPKGDGTANGKIPRDADAGRPYVALAAVAGGADSKRGQFVWQALVVADEASFCGGALVKSDVVLTAAQCVATFSKFKVILGANQRGVFEGGRLSVETDSKVVHPGFNPATLTSDLALLRLTFSVTSRINPFVKTVRLPRFADQSKTFVGKQGIVSGWGTIIKGGDVSDVLSHGGLTVLPSTNCSVYYDGQFGDNSGRVVSSSLCLSAPSAEPCKGDVGGPFVYKEADGLWTVLGVGSFASPAGCSEGPRVFARVPSFLSWIATTANVKVRA